MAIYQTTSLKHLDVNGAGTLIRITFDSRQGEVSFEIPVAAYETLLPFLANAKAEADFKSGSSFSASIFPTDRITIGGNPEGLILALRLPEGGEFAFRLDAEQARLLVTGIEQCLGQ